METNSLMMAGVMGALAFQKGIDCKPQHDSQLMGMALQGKANTVELFNEWRRQWLHQCRRAHSISSAK